MGITKCDVYYKVRQNRRWQERHKTIGLMSENNASASAFYILVHFLAVPCGLRVIPLAWFPGGWEGGGGTWVNFCYPIVVYSMANSVDPILVTFGQM